MSMVLIEMTSLTVIPSKFPVATYVLTDFENSTITRSPQTDRDVLHYALTALRQLNNRKASWDALDFVGVIFELKLNANDTFVSLPHDKIST